MGLQVRFCGLDVFLFCSYKDKVLPSAFPVSGLMPGGWEKGLIAQRILRVARNREILVIMLQRTFKPRLVSRRLPGSQAKGLFDTPGPEAPAQTLSKLRLEPPSGPLIAPSRNDEAGCLSAPAGSEKERQVARLRAALLKLENCQAAHGGQGLSSGLSQGLSSGLSQGLSSGLSQGLSSGLSLGDLDTHLPTQGLPIGVLNEVTADYAHRPAAFGFTFALMALGQKRRSGPIILVMSRRALRDFGHPYGHGLAQLGLDVGEVILVEADKDIDALWAIEEALRARGCVALVAGAVTGSIDLTAARRLNLAAASTATPLVVLRSGKMDTGPAATRWRLETTTAERDRYGGFGRWRWRASLERCRNGRPGEWIIEWCHVTHRFHLVESLADRSVATQPGRQRCAG